MDYFLAICNWLIFAVLGMFFSETFLRIFSSDEQILQMGISYMKICTLFSFGVFIQITYERIMQSTGNTIYNMIIQEVGALINIILDPILFFWLFWITGFWCKRSCHRNCDWSNDCDDVRNYNYTEKNKRGKNSSKGMEAGYKNDRKMYQIGSQLF